MKTEIVYVELLNEGTDTFRPTHALPLGSGVYQLLPTSDYDPEDEEWSFLPDERVVCEKRILIGFNNSKHERLVAIRRA